MQGVPEVVAILHRPVSISPFLPNVREKASAAAVGGKESSFYNYSVRLVVVVVGEKGEMMRRRRKMMDDGASDKGTNEKERSLHKSSSPEKLTIIQSSKYVKRRSNSLLPNDFDCASNRENFSKIRTLNTAAAPSIQATAEVCD